MGGADVGLLLSLCDANGKLLKPDKPARSVDAVWTSLVPGAAKGPPGTLWSTSVTKSNATWGYVLAARTSDKWTADAKTLGLSGKTDGYSWIREQTSLWRWQLDDSTDGVCLCRPEDAAARRGHQFGQRDRVRLRQSARHPGDRPIRLSRWFHAQAPAVPQHQRTHLLPLGASTGERRAHPMRGPAQGLPAVPSRGGRRAEAQAIRRADLGAHLHSPNARQRHDLAWRARQDGARLLRPIRGRG